MRFPPSSRHRQNSMNPSHFAHARYGFRLIDRFLYWGDHHFPKSGKIKGSCQPPLLDPLATLKDGSSAKTRGRLLYENDTLKMALARKRGQSRHKFAPVSRPTHAPAKLKRGGYLGVLTAISKSSE